MEQRLESYNGVDVDSEQCVFTNCRKMRRIGVQQLSIEGRLGDPVQLVFRDAAGEVHVREIEIGKAGDLVAVLQDRWEDADRGGYYSLLHHARELWIRDNSKAVRDLLSYAKGCYTLGQHWQHRGLPKGLRVTADCTEEDLPVIGQLRGYLKNVKVHRFEVRLREANVVSVNCGGCVFVACAGVRPQLLAIEAEIFGCFVSLAFCGVAGEVHIPELAIGPRGGLGSLIQNSWDNGVEDDKWCHGFYSLLPYAEELKISGNPQAVWDLADYAEERYWPGDDWQWQRLPRNMKIRILDPQGAFLAVKRLSAYFSDVTVDGRSPEEYRTVYEKALTAHFSRYGLRIESLERSTGPSAHIQLDGVYHVTECCWNPEELTVKLRLGADQFVCFHRSGPVSVGEIIVGVSGSLRGVLQNTWFNGVDGGFFSLLHRTKQLTVSGTPALQDLLDYVEGRYELKEPWEYRALNRDIKVVVNCTREDLPTVEKLRRHFRRVAIGEFTTELGRHNVLDVDCGCWVPVSRGGVQPQSVTIDAKISGPLTHIRFQNVGGAVCVPRIVIGPRGQFKSLICTHWCSNEEGNGSCGYYGLLHHAEAVVIRNNPKVVASLVAYVRGSYRVGASKWQVQPLEGTKVTIEGPAVKTKQANILAEHFGAITVNGGKILSQERQKALSECNRYEEALRPLRNNAVVGRRSLDKLVASLAGVIERTRDAGERLKKLQEQLGNLVLLASCAQPASPVH